MELEFVVPLHPEDLLSSDGETFVVDDSVVDLSSLEGALDAAADLLAHANNPSALFSNDVFDPIYCLMCKYGELDDMLKARLFDLLHSSLSAEVDTVDNFLANADPNNIDESFAAEQKTHRNALKMYCFLMQWFFSLAERADLDVGSSNNNSGENAAATNEGGGGGNKRKKKAAKKVVDDNDDDDEDDGGRTSHSTKKKTNLHLQEEWSWASYKGRVLAILAQVVGLDLRRLWSLGQPEAEFLNLFSRCAFQLFENPASVKDKQLRTSCVEIVGMCLKKFNFSPVDSFLRLLQNYEHATAALVDLVLNVMANYEASFFLTDVLRELSLLSFDDTTRDAGPSKNTGLFLQEMGEKSASHLLTCLEHIVPHLACECYTLRSGVVSALGSVLLCISKLSAQSVTKEIAQARMEVTQIMLDRIHDVSSFTRARCLQAWVMLVNEKAVPVKVLPQLAMLAGQRLFDKTTLPRKGAIQLLNSMMQYNPYSSELRLSIFEDQLTASKKLLESLTEKGVEVEEKEGEEEEAEEERKEQKDKEEDEEEKDTGDNNKEDKPRPTSAAELTEVEKQRLAVQFHQDAVDFIKHIEIAVEAMADILASKTSSDVIEAIEFYVSADSFKIKSARVGVRKMLFLIFSKEAAVKEAVITACQQLYMSPPSYLGNGKTAESEKARAVFIAMNLINLAKDASVGERACIEELLNVLLEKKLITSLIIKTLCDIFGCKFEGISENHSRGAAWVLSMLCVTDPDIVRSRISYFVAHGIVVPKAKSDAKLFMYTCSAFEKMGKRVKGKKDVIQKYANDHEMFVSMQERITGPSGNVYDNTVWFGAAETVINTVYAICDKPEEFCQETIRFLVQQVEGKPNSSAELCRLLFVVGHVALKELVHVENVQLDRKYKRMKAEEEKPAPSSSSTSATTAIAATTTTTAAGAASKSKKKAAAPVAPTEQKEEADKKEKEKEKEKEEGIEQQIGVGTTFQDDTDAEILNDICDRNIVTGGENLLALFSPLIVRIMSTNKFTDPALRMTASLTLCKFMIVSAEFCEKYLQLLFTVLATAPEEALRCNIVIALGDLAFRHPNLIEPYTSHLYQRLRDKSAKVRKTAVMVLTHLILNDMVKLRGQVSEMAVCMEDDQDDRIKDLALLFFHELSKKGNAIYNILPDAISTLSSAAVGDVVSDGNISTSSSNMRSGRISDEMFYNIMKSLFSFIDKEKHVEGLIEKLCHRFHTFDKPQQWRHLAFCLNLLSHSEKSIKKLQELFGCYADTLHVDEVFNSFTQILGKCRKFAKQEVKTAADELEAKMVETRNKQLEEIAAADAAAVINNPDALREKQRLARQKHLQAKKELQEQKKEQQQQGATTGAEGEEQVVVGADDDDDAEDDDDLADFVVKQEPPPPPASAKPTAKMPATSKPVAPAAGKKAAAPTKAKPKAKPKSKKKAVDSDEDDDDDDQDDGDDDDKYNNNDEDEDEEVPVAPSKRKVRSSSGSKDKENAVNSNAPKGRTSNSSSSSSATSKSSKSKLSPPKTTATASAAKKAAATTTTTAQVVPKRGALKTVKS